MNERTILRRARQILSEENRALELTLGSIDRRFVRAVGLIRDAGGKVVVIGVGKSGLVAQKIAATMNSLGTTAVFMHGSDGVHGDLGVLDSSDIVLVLSYSGATAELLSNLPTIRHMGAKIIAMTADLKSPLAVAADVVLPIVIEREACNLNLAPTSSTIAMMALGDALALVLSEIKGFRPEDFARVHPGGILGRRLLLKVADLMHGGAENPLATPSMPVADITDLLTRSRLGGVNIVNNRRSRRLVGVITDGDVRKALSRRKEFFNLRAGDIMTSEPTTVRADMLATEALELMENRPAQISVLPVLEKSGRCVGLLRVHDLLTLGQ